MPHRRAALLLVGLCLVRPAAGSATQAPRDSITVYGAADLSEVLPEIAGQYQAATGVAVTLVFGASGNLALQIERGAPADAFLAANANFIDRLIEKRILIAGTRTLYARGRLALVVQRALEGRLTHLADLRDSSVHRFAIANPDHAPYGMGAREALQAAGLWDSLQPKLVLGENIRQTLQYAQSGAVEAAIVSLSVVRGLGLVIIPIDSTLYRPIDQAAAVVVRSRHARQAAEFIAYLVGPGWPIMARNGFARPPVP